MARLVITYQNLYDRVSHFLGLTAEGTSPTSTDLTLCKSIVDRGLRQFLYPINIRTGQLHQWQFLKKFATFTTVSDKWKYALPPDFSDLYTTIHYDTDELQPSLIRRDADQILEMRADVVTKEWPQYFAIVPSTYDIEIGTTYELWLYPTPDQTYILNYFYRFDPIKLSATSDVAVGGIRACEAILESCLAVAETQEEDNTSTHHQAEAARLIQTLISADTTTKSEKIGNLYKKDEIEWPPKRPLLVPYQDSNIYSS